MNVSNDYYTEENVGITYSQPDPQLKEKSSHKKRLNDSQFNTFRGAASIAIVLSVGLYAANILTKKGELYLMIAGFAAHLISLAAHYVIKKRIYSEPVTGEVISYESKCEFHSGDTHTYYAANLRIRYGAGMYITKQRFELKPIIGDTIELLADPDDPTDTIFAKSSVLNIVLTAIGIAATIGVAAYLYRLF